MTTLDPLFGWFLQATLRASLLTLAVLTVQVILRGRMPARWRYAMWLPVVLAMAAPWLPRSRWSLEDRVASVGAAAVRGVSTYLRPSAKTARTSAPGGLMEFQTGNVNGTESVVTAASATKMHQRDWKDSAMACWLIGVLGVSGFMVAAYARTTKKIRNGARAADETVVLMLAEAVTSCGLARVPEMVVSAEVESPAVSGFLRPVLLLPIDFPGKFTPAEATLVLRHELMHIRRHDLAVNWALCLLQAIHWCNPMLWLAFARMRADREAACDAAVLAGTEMDSRADYGHALLKLESSLAGSGLSLGLVGIFDRAAGLRARVAAIGRYRRAHGGWAVAGVTLMVALALAGATRAQLAGGSKAKDGTQEATRATPNEPVRAATPNQKLAAKMQAIVIPKLEFRDATIVEALDFLRTRSVALDPEKKGVNIVLSLAAPRAPGTPAPAIVPTDARITVSLTNIPLIEALKYVTSLTETKFRIGASAVEVVPRDALDPLVTREWKIDPATQKTLGNAPVEVLKASGVSFPPGAAIDLSRDGRRLIMKNSEENQDLLDSLLAEGAAPTPDAGGEPDPRIGILKKLDSIIIPKLDFRDATLREAIDFLKKKSVQLDPDPDPAKRGFSIVLKLEGDSAPGPVPVIPGLAGAPPPAPEAQPAPSDSHLTMSLTNVPIGEALKYVVNLAGCKFTVEPFAVSIVPLGSASYPSFSTKEWRISDAMRSTLGMDAAGDAKAQLSAKGITFPEGAMASWVPLTKRLVVKNTAENLEKVDQMLAPPKQ